jgi:hypothetical protein
MSTSVPQRHPAPRSRTSRRAAPTPSARKAARLSPSTLTPRISCACHRNSETATGSRPDGFWKVHSQLVWACNTRGVNVRALSVRMVPANAASARRLRTRARPCSQCNPGGGQSISEARVGIIPRATSSAVGRSAGSLATQRSTRRLTSGARSARRCPTGVGVSRRWAAAQPIAVVALNGSSPTSTSYAITPRLYTSLLGLSGSPPACSGLM